MSTSVNISKNPPDLESMDYTLLRKKGIESLQALSGTTWTDHNVHDPGITILETLCYAITELGNRINLPIEDILASQSGLTEEKLQSVFPKAQQVLPNCAWTEKDLRKILIDIEGVRNIYLHKADQAEQEFFFDSGINLLTYAPSSIPVNINGLYIIKVELAQSEDFGDLNSNILNTSIVVDPGSGPISFDVSISVPYWDDVDPFWLSPGSITDIILTSPISEVADAEINSFFGELTIEINGTDLIENFSFRALVDPPIDPLDPSLITEVITALEILAQNTTPDSILSYYKNRLQETNEIIQEVQQKFYTNRNLCEDILRIEAVRIQEIALFTTIEILPDIDPNKLLAQIYFVIDQFLCPTFPWHSLEILKEEGLRLDEILEGPLLTRGFIKNQDLDAIIREGTLYTSDLVGLMMSQEGVFSVYELALSNFIDNINVIGDARVINCLRLIDVDRYKPKFSATKSEILFIRNNIEVPIDQAQVQTALEDLKNAAALIPGTSDLGLEIPEGEKLDLNQYHSIQHEFPATYGVGNNNIATSASNLRIAQSQQLRAYLTFFDQMLANCSSQVANLCQFYAPDQDITQTYYNKPLYQLPGMENLLLGYLQSGMTYEAFIADPENSYQQGLSNYFENDTVFIDRRSRLLDHLLARFGESFPDSSSLQYSGLTIHLINDKLNYFRKYPALSSNRGKAFGIEPQIGGGDVWNSDNISGLQKKISALLGIANPLRRNFSMAPDPNEYFEFFISGPNFGFRFLDNNDDILLQSELFPNQNAAEILAVDVIGLGVHTSSYGVASVQNIAGVDFLIVPIQNQMLTTIANARIELDASVSQDLQRIQVINKVQDNLLQVHKEGEGFYLIEHVLLRPIRNDISNVDAFMPTFLNQEETLPVSDPYSFRMSFFFPSGFERDFGFVNASPAERIWSFRLRSCGFREFLKRMIREETPAHILPEIYFLDTNIGVDNSTTPSLNNFEIVYRNWLETKTDSNATGTDLTNSHNALVAVFENIVNLRNHNDCI